MKNFKIETSNGIAEFSGEIIGVKGKYAQVATDAGKNGRIKGEDNTEFCDKPNHTYNYYDNGGSVVFLMPITKFYR